MLDKEKLDKLYYDTYIGDGKENPSITVRLAMGEDKIDRMIKNINKALWLALATLLGIIADIVGSHLKG